MPLSIGEWLLNYYNQHHVFHTAALECTVEPGDVVFVPHGWWHAVFNLSDTMNVAITHNYVSRSNLPSVLRFLDTKQSSISGCRDRVESIKPEYLLGALERELETNGMGQLLQEAQQVALEGWPCRAWTDDNDENVETITSKRKKRNKRRQRQETLLDTRSIMTRAKQSLPTNEAFTFSFL